MKHTTHNGYEAALRELQSPFVPPAKAKALTAFSHRVAGMTEVAMTMEGEDSGDRWGKIVRRLCEVQRFVHAEIADAMIDE
jgi:hypothetical protein